ncbi:MAG: hypothetical protein ACKOCN_12115, partial [Planctomycetaceae bacterium]
MTRGDLQGVEESGGCRVRSLRAVLRRSGWLAACLACVPVLGADPRPTTEEVAIAPPAPFANAPFGPDHPELDRWATGEWWNLPEKIRRNRPFELDVPRDQVIAFALYTVDLPG